MQTGFDSQRSDKMCGIVGYLGKKQAGPLLLEGLRRLEYRGYDSAGLSVANKNNKITTLKTVGKIDNLVSLAEKRKPKGCWGIGHSRWATHGEVNEKNAHPHWDCQKNIFLVHNGIIENYRQLKEKLIKEGHKFLSETDTEVLAHLIEKFFNPSTSSGQVLEEAVIKALKLVKGTYGLAIISKDDPEKIVVARNSSPILIGVSDGEYLVASDASAILAHTKKVVYLNDREIAVITPKGINFTNLGREKLLKKTETLEWDLEKAQKPVTRILC